MQVQAREVSAQSHAHDCHSLYQNTQLHEAIDDRLVHGALKLGELEFRTRKN